jgi:hypothetical protein
VPVQHFHGVQEFRSNRHSVLLVDVWPTRCQSAVVGPETLVQKIFGLKEHLSRLTAYLKNELSIIWGVRHAEPLNAICASVTDYRPAESTLKDVLLARSGPRSDVDQVGQLLSLVPN